MAKETRFGSSFYLRASNTPNKYYTYGNKYVSEMLRKLADEMEKGPEKTTLEVVILSEEARDKLINQYGFKSDPDLKIQVVFPKPQQAATPEGFTF